MVCVTTSTHLLVIVAPTAAADVWPATRTIFVGVMGLLLLSVKIILFIHERLSGLFAALIVGFGNLRLLCRFFRLFLYFPIRLGRICLSNIRDLGYRLLLVARQVFVLRLV